MDIIYQTAEVAVAASTTKSIIKVTAPTGRSMAVLEWGISSRGSSGDALRVRLGRITTAEPTYGDILALRHVAPNAGGYEKVFTIDAEEAIGTADAVAVEVTSQA